MKRSAVETKLNQLAADSLQEQRKAAKTSSQVWKAPATRAHLQISCKWPANSLQMQLKQTPRAQGEGLDYVLCSAAIPPRQQGKTRIAIIATLLLSPYRRKPVSTEKWVPASAGKANVFPSRY